MRTSLFRLGAAGLLSVSLGAQGAGYTPGQVISVVTALPPTCTASALVVRSSDATLHICTATNTFTQVGWSTGGFVTGDIIFTLSACRAGFTEVAGLNGRMLLGTVAANGNVGTTGGSDSVTPTTASVTWPAGVPTNGAIAIGTFVNTATATTGNCAATNILAGTGSGTACKAAAPNLTVPAEGHSGSLTAPTISWPAGVPAVTLNAVDTRSAFVRLIGCQKT